MRILAVIVAALTLAPGLARAQDRLSLEEAQMYAKLFAEAAKKLDDAPLKTDADPEKPAAVRHDKYGALVMPVKDLSADAIAKAGKDAVPIGQFYLHNLAPSVDGQAIPDDKLRTITVPINGEDLKFPVLWLGVRKKGEGDLELVGYSKEKEPVLRLPLKKVEGGEKTEVPIDLDGRNNGDTGEVTFKILGKYEAKLILTPKQS
jgi:hypothetical protein